MEDHGKVVSKPKSSECMAQRNQVFFHSSHMSSDTQGLTVITHLMTLPFFFFFLFFLFFFFSFFLFFLIFSFFFSPSIYLEKFSK
jgi:hypothetical protein